MSSPPPAACPTAANDIVFSYVGYFSQSLITSMAETLRRELQEHEQDSRTRRRLFSSFVEMSQNILRYSADTLTPPEQPTDELRHGALSLHRQDEHYLLCCANPVRSVQLDGLRRHLDSVCRMDPAQARAAHRDGLRGAAPDGSKGAGLGLLTLARDASSPLDYALRPLDDGAGHLFSLRMTI